MQPGPTTGGCPELGLRPGERVSPLLVPSGTDGVWFGPRFFHPSIRRSFPGRPVCFRVRLGGRDLPFIWGAVHWEQQLLPHRSMQHSGLAALPAAGAPGLRIRRGYCDYRCADGAGARRGADQRHAGDHGRGHHLGPEPDSGRHPGGFGHCPGHGGGAGHRPDALGPLEVDRDGANFSGLCLALPLGLSGLRRLYTGLQHPRSRKADLRLRGRTGLPQAIINLGKDLNVPVVDMTSLTKKLYDSLGAAETVNLHAWTSSKPESVDNTHTNIWGGTYNAYLVTKTIKELNVAGLAEHIIDAKAPTKSDVLKSNPDYKESEYSNDLKDSELWANAGIFKGTVFGNVGGNDKIASKFKLESLDNGNINIAVNGAGKIASTADGIAMYYYRVPANSNFTITAKATVNSFTSNDQVSFGLMARDDMYVDQYINSTMGDYVAAGPLKLTKKDSVWNCFARKSGALTQGGTCANEIKAGETYNLKIESNTDGYACTFGNEETITGGFDFKLTSVDSEYVYVGMYVARSADVTFSDVKLVVDGKEITSAGEPENPTPGEPENPTPGEPENPTPGEPENPAPGEPENPTPGEPENPAPT